MLFSSNLFLFFFLPAVLLGYYILPRRLRNLFLLAASLLFYAWGTRRFVLVMIGSILFNYLIALLMQRFTRTTVRKLLLILAVAGNLGVLFVYKYLDFFISNLNRLGFQLPLQNIALPLGISFFTFQAMSYVIDVYRRSARAQIRPQNIGLYISFFPQLVAGPIVRYQTIADQIDHRRETFADFSEGVRRFILGFSKKIILSNNMALVADAVFSADPGQRSVIYAWMGAFAYAFQILFDFSGYSDMAIGIAAIWDFDLGKNFNLPYLAENPSDFWRRWHISLSSWFRDYVYIPLGGSRRGKLRTYVNLFITMVLSGLWHGANATYLVWGAYHGLGCVIHRLLGKRGSQKTPWQTALCTAANCLFVSAGWVIFRADSMAQAMAVFCGLFRRDGICYVNVFVVIYGLVIALTHLYARFRLDGNAPTARLALDTFRGKLLLCVWVFLIATLMYCGNSAFIYANF